jgi:hypothetical protein
MSSEGECNVTKRVLLATFVVAATMGSVNNLQGSDRAPETGITLIYNSSTKGEIEECG